MKKFALFAIVAVAFALFILASGSSSVNAAPAQPQHPQAAPQQAPTKKILRIGRGTYPDVIDPQKSSFGVEIEVLKLAYEGLLAIDNKGNIGEGSSDKFEASADGSSMTFHIRDGLKRHDGTPMACADFEYALKREVDPTIPGKQYTSILYDIKGAAELDALASEDPTTIDKTKLDEAWKNYGVACKDASNLVVTFKNPVGFWQYVAYTWVTYPSDKRQVDADPDLWWDKPEGHVGNGPFIIKTIEQGKKITFEPNANYWRGRPKLDRLELIYNTDNAVILEAYKKGELDIDANIAGEQIAAIQADPQLKAEFLRYPAAISIALLMNNTKAPLGDVNVRKAFSAAFDRASYITDVRQGRGGPYTRWIPPGVPGALPDKPGVPGYDPKAAVDFLVNNGYAAADSTADKPKVDCNKIGTLKLTYGATPLNHARMQFIAGNIVRVMGCPVTLDPVDATVATAISKDVKTNPPLSVGGWIQDYPHPQNWLTVYWTCNGFGKRTGYCNKDFDALLAKADATVNFEEAIKQYQAAEDILINDTPSAFIYYDENFHMVKPWVIGPKDYPSSSDAEWAGEWGPVWTYDIDLTKVPAGYPEQ